MVQTVGAATTTSANELIFGAGTTACRFSAAGTGFVSRLLPTPDEDNGEDKVVSSNGSYNATATLTSSTTWGHADGYLQGEALAIDLPPISR